MRQKASSTFDLGAALDAVLRYHVLRRCRKKSPMLTRCARATAIDEATG